VSLELSDVITVTLIVTQTGGVPGLDYIHVYSPSLVVLDSLLAHGPSIPRCIRKELRYLGIWLHVRSLP
jgi:hypothetical protein